MSVHDPDPIIAFSQVSKAYEIHDANSNILRLALFGTAQTSQREALRDISFTIRRGECVGIVGQNGAGKSTLLKLIAGTLQPTSGRIDIKGRVSAILELGTGFNLSRSGRENVIASGLVLGMTRAEIDRSFDQIVAFSEIGTWIDEPVRTYSTGMVMRLAFAVATAITPDILIVDEAISVGDAKFQKKCFGRFEAMRAAGTTILLVTHTPQLIEMICDRGLYLAQGRLLADGPPKPVVARYLEDLFGPPESAVASVVTTETQEQRYGNGGVDIHTVELEDETGRPIRTTLPGQRCRIRVGLRVLQEEEIHGLNVGVAITTKEGVRLFAINPTLVKQLFPVMRQGDEATVIVDLTMNLGVGDFFISVGARSFQTEGHFDRRVDVRHFSVRGDYALSQCLVDLKASYHIATAPAEVS